MKIPAGSRNAIGNTHRIAREFSLYAPRPLSHWDYRERRGPTISAAIREGRAEAAQAAELRRLQREIEELREELLDPEAV